jgi:threonine/homoserine/homoserine lactone efflux protein
MDKKPTAELLGKVIGSLLMLGLFTVLLKSAFNFTWLQGFSLGYLFWLLQDAIQNVNPKD